MSRPRRQHPRLALGCVGLGLAMVVLGFWSIFATNDAYLVRFSQPGAECEGRALTLDADDGEPLLCNFSETGSRRFTPAERSQLVTLARQLGRDGLSEADRAMILALNERIAETHGNPGLASERVASAGHAAAVIGLPVAMLGWFWFTRSLGAR